MVNTRAKIKKTRTSLLQESIQSAALIGSNDDLLTEILHRLPAYSILRFKSVSKHWQWLLSQSHFIRMHDHLSKSPGFFTIDNIYVPYDDVENRSAPFRSFDFQFYSRGIRVLQSCNGLMLCCSNRVSTGARKYYIFNPTTKQLALIESVPGGLEVGKTICFMYLAFHQTDCFPYKVVCIRSLEPDIDFLQIQIYSSDTRKWKVSIQSVCMNWSIFTGGVYWNGAIHWASSYRDYFCFKLETEQLTKLPLPKGMKSFETKMYFGESRGHLHMIVADNYYKISLQVNVYEMLRDHSRWFVKYQVRVPNVFPEMFIPPCYYDFQVIDVVRGEKEEDTFIVLMIKSKTLIRYNVHDKSYKQIFNFTRDLYGRCLVEAHRYIESLSSF